MGHNCMTLNIFKRCDNMEVYGCSLMLQVIILKQSLNPLSVQREAKVVSSYFILFLSLFLHISMVMSDGNSLVMPFKNIFGTYVFSDI